MTKAESGLNVDMSSASGTTNRPPVAVMQDEDYNSHKVLYVIVEEDMGVGPTAIAVFSDPYKAMEFNNRSHRYHIDETHINEVDDCIG